MIAERLTLLKGIDSYEENAVLSLGWRSSDWSTLSNDIDARFDLPAGSGAPITTLLSRVGEVAGREREEQGNPGNRGVSGGVARCSSSDSRRAPRRASGPSRRRDGASCVKQPGLLQQSGNCPTSGASQMPAEIEMGLIVRAEALRAIARDWSPTLTSWDYAPRHGVLDRRGNGGHGWSSRSA